MPEMTPRERLLAVLSGKIPDCVPVTPDMSNMIPARLTGKPFWDIYLFNDPPIWEAHIAAAKHFDIDGFMDGLFANYQHLDFGDEPEEGPEWERFIVYRSAERIVTQASYIENGKRTWQPTVDVYYIADPPTGDVPPGKIGLPPVPESWEPLEGVKPVDTGPAGFKRAKELMGDQGIIGLSVTTSAVLRNPQDLYHYYDNPGKHEQGAAGRVERAEQYFRQLMSMQVKPDFISVGGSGTLVFQTVEIFRKLAFPAVKRGIELATAAGIPTHVHSCGPEKALVKIFAEETNLTVIDPLEPPPMGDCDLAELKRLYGDRIVLKGNLHTTDVMLRGSVEEVANASKRAIDDAATGGRFILSTGDQCSRDTPDQNIRAMVETARTYGKY
jgi:uroporphyrinogen decarboxylase